MMATIYMSYVDDSNEYPYGTYPYNTNAEKNRVNDIAAKIVEERGCNVRVESIKGNI